MCGQGMLAMRKLHGAFRGLRGWQFVSHKLRRWLSLIPMLVMLGSSAALAPGSAFFASVLGLQGIFYGFAALGLAKAFAGRPGGHLTAVPFYVMLGLLGALVGVVEAFLGR